MSVGKIQRARARLKGWMAVQGVKTSLNVYRMEQVVFPKLGGL